MTLVRPQSVPGEKPLFWAGSSKADLMEFPNAVKDEIGTALSVAQFGGKHPKAKPWKGEGPGVLEIVADHRGDTYQAAYTAKFEHAVYGAACLPEEVAEGQKDGSERCGPDFAAAQNR
jgi:phage-related protein